MQIASESLLLS